MEHSAAAPEHAIDVFLADDNLIVREGVRALIERNADLRVVGVAADYDGVVAGCADFEPQVLVTDVRMPPSFHREGIDAAKEVRKRHPGTGIVVLSQYDDPEYAVSLLAEGSAGYGYLLKDRIAEGDQLADAIRAVATRGNALDPAIVEALGRPVVAPGGLLPAEEELLGMVAEGKPIKAIAISRGLPPEAVDTEVEAVFLKLAAGVSTGRLPQAGRRRLHRRPGSAEPPPDAPSGHREPRGAGRDAFPAAARRAGREAPSRAPAHRRDRAGGSDRADERHQVLLEHRRARRPDPASRAAQYPPCGDEPGHPRRSGHRHAVRGRCGDGRLRRPVPAGRPRGPRGSCGSGHALPPGGDQHPLGGSQAACVRPGHRAVDRPGRGGPARLGGTP